MPLARVAAWDVCLRGRGLMTQVWGTKRLEGGLSEQMPLDQRCTPYL